MPSGPCAMPVTSASKMKRAPRRAQAPARPSANLWMSPVESEGVKKPPWKEPWSVGSMRRISSGVTARRSRPPSRRSSLTRAAASKPALSR